MDIIDTRFGSIPMEELAGLPNFYLPSLSHDRKQIAFYWDKPGRVELFVMNTEPGSVPRQISKGQMPRALRAGFVWTRDNKEIIFAKDNDGDEQHNLWKINVETGEATQLTDNPKCQEYPVEVSPDNKTLLVNTNLKGQLNLFALDLETCEYTQLTDFQFPAMAAIWSPDGKQIVFGTNETANLKNADVYLMNADGGNQRRILQLSEGSRDMASDWSADGRYLAVGSDHWGGARVGVYDLETEELRWLSPEDKTIYPGEFSPDGRYLLAINNEYSMAAVAAYNVEMGEQEAIELPPGMSYNTKWLDNERFTVNIMTDTTRPELRDYDIRNGGSNVILPAEYGSINPDVFAGSEYISYNSSDGLEIHAIVYRPRNMEPGKKYPGLVEIHGGPTAQFFRAFNERSQLLADAGYIIIQPNIRGSTGYGVEFRDMNLKDWGGGDLEDVEAAAEYIKSLPEVDSERIGVWGGSYGGYMTFMAVTKKPHLWKAGVAWVGITDLKALHDSSMDHFKYYLRQQMGDPEKDAELWADRSAVNFAHQMSAHLLIVHGTNDPRCPIEQAHIFRDKLIELGKKEGEHFEYVEFNDEGHGSNDIEHKTRSHRILLDYFARHL